MQVKLIDFGAGHWAKTGPLVADKFIGTLQFMAPEVIIARGDDFDASDASQIESTVQIEFKKRPFGIRKYKPGHNLRHCSLHICWAPGSKDFRLCCQVPTTRVLASSRSSSSPAIQVVLFAAADHGGSPLLALHSAGDPLGQAFVAGVQNEWVVKSASWRSK